MSQINNLEEINMLKELFNKSCDTLSPKIKDHIKYNINKHGAIYKRYINKIWLNKAQHEKLDNSISILNQIYDYLSNISASNSLLTYSPNRSFIINDNYAINKIHSIKALFDNKRASLSIDDINDIRKQIYENVKRYDTYKANKIANKKQRTTFKDLKASLNELYDHILNIETSHVDDTYHLEDLYEHSAYYMPTAVAQAFDGSYVKHHVSGDNTSSMGQYFNKIWYYLHNLVNNYKKKGEWKVQLSMHVIFSNIISANKTDILHTKSDNVEILKGYDTNTIINELKNSLVSRYQEGLEHKLNGSNYVFDHIHLLEIHLNKISINRGSTYTKTCMDS